MRALLVEDNPGDVRLIQELFRQTTMSEPTEVEVVDRLSTAINRINRGGIDIILLDLGLPDSQGAETFQRVRDAAKETPVVVLTSLEDEKLALKTIQNGAQHYLVKGSLNGHSLVRETLFAVERERVEAELRARTEQLNLLLDSTAGAICGADTSGKCTFCNDSAAKLLGYSSARSLVGQDLHALVHHTRADGSLYPREECRILHAVLRGENIEANDEVFWRADGTSFPVEYRSNPIVHDGKVVGGVLAFEDVTERRRAEAMSEERRRLATFASSLGRAVTRGGPLREVLGRCTDEMVQHLDASFARIWTLNAEEQVLELQASSGIYTELHGTYGRVPVGKYNIGRIAADKKAHLSNDVLNDPDIGDPEWPRREGMTAFAGHPLLVEGELVGVMAMFARRPLSDFTLRALSDTADPVSLFIKRNRADLSLESAEKRLRQGQTMEALSRLAGGVAHDFNNVLTVILGYGELAANEAQPQSALSIQLGEIRKAAERAARITRQLLSFGRPQVAQPRVLNPNQLILEMESMLDRMIDDRIKLSTSLDPEIGHVRADPGQLDQVLMNLTVNAREAMATGGTLTIETANADLGEAEANLHTGLSAGRYVVISITDTGIGMSEETLSRMFEPFFTAKDQGDGAGLGLSTVYGIVQQSRGSVSAQSELGRGTTMRVYLPRVNAPLEVSVPRQESPGFYRGTECVLLIEDDDAVRSLARAVLEQLGYKVVEAASPAEALELAKGYESEIHIALTDVILPGMSGRELVERLCAIRPEMRLLFMSGYAQHLMTSQGVLEPGVDFVEKPFTAESLACKVREVLDRKTATGETW